MIRRFDLIPRSFPAASTEILRRRGLRVLNLGRWRLVYAPRNHWSNHL